MPGFPNSSHRNSLCSCLGHEVANTLTHYIHIFNNKISIKMSGVVVVDDYADEVAEEEPISAEDEQNLKEIEDYIFNNVS